MQKTLRIGMVGYGFMGAAHSQGWRTAPRAFSLPMAPELVAIAGRNPEQVLAAQHRFGFVDSTTRWQDLIDRDDIDLIDICAPGNVHAEIAIAALDAGKHVLCEKPLANGLDEAEAMAEAAARAAERGTFSMVGFNYRRVPAVLLAQEMVQSGKIGNIRHVRAVYLQDWLNDEESPLTWRLDRSLAGSGALGDIGAHIIDLAQFVTGSRIEYLQGHLRTFVSERPKLGESKGLSGRASGDRGAVTVDDAALFTAQFSNGVIGSFEATRMAAGRKNAMTIEINGSRGSLSFDLERMNELRFFDATTDPRTAGFSTILVTDPEHPYLDGWWPPGHMLGYENSFSNQARDLVFAISEQRMPSPSFDDGLQIQRVLHAIETSSGSNGTWSAVTFPPASKEL
ncbi:putative dehydrogenase [Mycetocola sp. CAN_C7]|uniref:Gfo/Idh/MocA family protein n=1 Tax=Mycetocola sp. CAN_C7 TaxID=2787724 RepID=UPI001A26E3B8